jgi:hypothetical protein
MVVQFNVGIGGWGTKEELTPGGCSGAGRKACNEGGRVGGAGCASRVCDRFAFALIARHDASAGARETCRGAGAVGRAMRPTRA